MEKSSSEIVGQVNVRAATFWRVLYQVYNMTKEVPNAFPSGKLLLEENKNKIDKEDEMILSMILEMNMGCSARANFLTDDQDLLAKATLKVIRAFTEFPSLYSKILACYSITVIGSAYMGIMSEQKESAMIKRSREIVDTSKLFHEISKTIVGLDVMPTTIISSDGRDQYMCFSVTTI